jgi:hypothetical protein
MIESTFYSAPLPRSGGTDPLVRLGEEVQKVLRRGGGGLSALWLSLLFGVSRT